MCVFGVLRPSRQMETPLRGDFGEAGNTVEDPSVGLTMRFLFGQHDRAIMGS